MVDAVVIGSGPNGLVAANLLADAGWVATVLEAQPTPGGAVRSSELLEPGFVNDHCSAFYPLGAGSPVMKALELEKYGLRWCHAPYVIAHPASDGSCPVISRDIDETCASLGVDGDAWRALYAIWEAKGDELLDALFTPFPPVRNGLRITRGLAWKEIVRLARFAVLPVRRMGEEYFESSEARRLIAGLALHVDLLPEANLSGFYGYLLAGLGQSVGFPSPAGGAGQLTAAMIKRLETKGGAVRCNARVSEVLVRNGRASGVKIDGGEVIGVSQAVMADVDATQLYTQLLPAHLVPADVKRDIRRFQYDSATVKVDWNLDAPVPWAAGAARSAGTVHIAEDIDELSVTASELARNVVPANPFLLFGQQSMTDPTRSPAGKETAWAYTHIPFEASLDADELERFADKMQARVELLAPGFTGSIRKRLVTGPADFERANANLARGALGGGTAQLQQQLIFRPVSGLGRPETSIPGLFLASSSAHPGGGVHGACGANAARAALRGRVRQTFVDLARHAGKLQSRNKKPLVP